MKFKIEGKIFKKFPSLNIGVLVCKNINNQGESTEILDLLADQSNQILKEHSVETLKENSKIQVWKDAYRSFGAKKYNCSIENLYRMILDGVKLKHINKIVDIYNYISLKYQVPVGGDDLDEVEGDITLRFALGDEVFIRLNSDVIDHPKEGEIIYSDDKEVLCRRWNWRECNKSKMTEDSKNIMLVVEGLSPINLEDIQVILEHLSKLIKKFCGGEVKSYFLNLLNTEIEI